MATENQVRANRENARLSTGPKSAAGKAIVSSNRICHGILSTKLLLEGECPEDYQALLDDLHFQLKAEGALEHALVEKIAVTLWRQQRLIRAESATIAMAANPQRIARDIEYEMSRTSVVDSDDMFSSDPKLPPDPVQLKWVRDVVVELHETDSLNPDNLQRAAPLSYQQLVSEAESEDESITEFLAGTGLQGYLHGLKSWCGKELRNAELWDEQYPTRCAITDRVKDSLNIAWSKLETLTKYQTTLDGQLYKAMKALHDAQQWRAQSIATEAISILPAEVA
ncbi:MAG: hypothetical protein O3A13_16525 [Proteobacteria bacterium]|nr:hypothetical protein [Pseudomonadota bacterium]